MKAHRVENWKSPYFCLLWLWYCKGLQPSPPNSHIFLRQHLGLVLVILEPCNPVTRILSFSTHHFHLQLCLWEYWERRIQFFNLPIFHVRPNTYWPLSIVIFMYPNSDGTSIRHARRRTHYRFCKYDYLFHVQSIRLLVQACASKE